MADKSGSPAFKPPMDRVTESDPQIIRVGMDKTDWAGRKSQWPSQDQGATKPLRNIPNEG
jgi:hypothetical protein